MKDTENVTVQRDTQEREERLMAATPFAFAAALAVYFVYVYLFSFLSAITRVKDGALGAFNESAMVKYLVGLLLLMGAFLAFRVLFARVLPHEKMAWMQKSLSRRGQNALFITLCALMAAYLLVYVFYTESSGVLFGVSIEDFVWRQLPMPVTVCGTAVLAAWVLHEVYAGKDLSRVLLYGTYGMVVLLTYVSLLYLNMTDVYHGIAYTESIYNVYGGAPYNLITTGIYGHYGIFFGLLLRIFSGNAEMMFHLIALTGALSAAACMYAVHHLSRKNWLRAIAAFGAMLTVILLREHNYWQAQPHRVLFPLLIVAFLCYMAKKGTYSKRQILVGFVLASVGVVWNTESGLFATAAFAVALVAHYWQEERWCSKRMWLIYAALVGGVVAAVAGAVLLVNLYNLCCGGGFILREFFFPMFEGSYMNGFLKVGPPYGVQVWILVLILFFALLLYGLWHTRLLRRAGERDAFAPVAVGLAAVALLQYSYYANRAAYFNLDLCCQLAVLAMLLFADRYLEDWRDMLKKALSPARVITAVLSLSCVAVMAVMAAQAPLASAMLLQRERNGQWNVVALDAQAAQWEALVPEEDCLVVGLGTAVLNLQLERGSPEYYRDVSDLYIGGTAVEEQMAADALRYGKVAFCFPDDIDRSIVTNVLSGGDFRLVRSGPVGELYAEVYELQK